MLKQLMVLVVLACLSGCIKPPASALPKMFSMKNVDKEKDCGPNTYRTPRECPEVKAS
jgi:hypothetical protein